MSGAGGPGVDRPVAHIAWQLREQGRICAFMNSPLYAALLAIAADDAEKEGIAWSILRGHLAPGRGNALALRFMAALHRVVLTGKAPALAAHYPGVGGDGDIAAACGALLPALQEHASFLADAAALPCQTNEVGRSAALIRGLLEVATRPGPLAMSLLEVGSSAGLNLRLDQFRYGGGGAFFGPADSPVDLTGMWRDAPPRTDLKLRIVSRRGCDPRPLDPASDEARLALRSSVWADQLPRFARLEGALALARAVPAPVDQASVAEWLPQQLAEPLKGAATVVFHSIVDEYFDVATRNAFHAALRDAGARATDAQPLAWVRLEPHTDIRDHGLWVTTWPGGETRLLATCGAHGQDVRAAG